MATATESMKTTRTDLNPCTVQIVVECTKEQIDKGFQKALKTIGKNLRVPGFRPGHVPPKMLEGMVNPQQWSEEAANEIIMEVAPKVIEEAGVMPHARPNVFLQSFEKEPPALTFIIKIPLAPIVELSEYKGIPVNKTKHVVEPEEVNRQVEMLRQKQGKKQLVMDRGAEAGDMAVINLKLEDGETKNFMIVVGQSFDGLDKALKGMKAEEFKAVKLDFPDTFQEKAWAGKKHSVTLTVRSLSEVKIPELNDEFATSLQTESVADLKARIEQNILFAKEQAAGEMVNEQLLSHLLEKSKVEVADNTWEQVSERRLQEMAEELAKTGSNLETYAENQNMSFEQFKEAQEAEAKLHVRRALIVERIFQNEQMQLTEDDVNRQFYQIAVENGVTDDNLEAFAKKYGPQLREEVIFRSMYARVMSFLAENAKVTEVAAGGEDKPKKAAKAKAEAAPAEKKPKAKK